MSDLLLLAAGAVVLGSCIVGHIDAHHSSTEREINRALGMSDRCLCGPCPSGGSGHPLIKHCAACCFGKFIEFYDHHCPIDEHRELAVAQWGPWEDSWEEARQ